MDSSSIDTDCMFSTEMPFVSEYWFSHVLPMNWPCFDACIGIGSTEIGASSPGRSNYIEITAFSRGIQDDAETG